VGTQAERGYRVCDKGLYRFVHPPSPSDQPFNNRLQPTAAGAMMSRCG
jgi:hypothetical protein